MIGAKAFMTGSSQFAPRNAYRAGIMSRPNVIVARGASRRRLRYSPARSPELRWQEWMLAPPHAVFVGGRVRAL